MSTPAVQAEEALIGALLISPEEIKTIAPLVDPADFASGRLREVYRTILALHERGVPGDYVLVEDELERRGTLEKVGVAFILDLINKCPASYYAEHYARRVRENGLLKRPGARPKAPSLSDSLGLEKGS